jgi:hypothetical protein
MSKYAAKPLLPGQLDTFSLKDRESKVKIADFARACAPNPAFSEFLQSLPDVLAGENFNSFVKAWVRARQENRSMILAMGAHVIKVGLSPVIIDLMQQGWISALALNGAGIIHDFEIALAGATSEDVDKNIQGGEFGMARETGEQLNAAAALASQQDIGLGEAVGQMLSKSGYPYLEHSLLASAFDMSIPVSVHVALGTDIIHFHPQVSGEDLGRSSLRDFFLFCRMVQGLDGGGIYFNAGSAVILPEVFLKAVSFVRNRGYSLESFHTGVCDFIRHYRPEQNVVQRPLRGQGRGYYFVGQHELFIPLLAAALKTSGTSD